MERHKHRWLLELIEGADPNGICGGEPSTTVFVNNNRMPPMCREYRDESQTSWSSELAVSWGQEALTQSFLQGKKGNSVKDLCLSPSPIGPRPSWQERRVLSSNTTPPLSSTSIHTASWRKCASGWAGHVLARLAPQTSGAASRVAEKRPHCCSYLNASHCGLSTKSCPSGCSFQVGQRVYIYGAFKA